MNLAGKTALVTGGGSGIGQAVAYALAGQGCRVVISGRRAAPLAATAAACEGEILFRAADVGRRAEAEALVDWSLTQLGQLDILVNNAGINVVRRALAELDPDDWDAMLRINASGTYYCTRQALGPMRARGQGVIVNIVSIAGRRAGKLGGVGYNASKFAQHALGITVGLEEAKNGIRVTNIYPGEVDTPILENRPLKVTAEHRARILQPQDVADAVLFVIGLPQRARVPELVITPATYDYL